MLPAWRAAAGRARRVRVWSAGCASGEEPFSIAMSLAWHLPGWQVENEHHLHRTYTFPDFRTALDFVNRVGSIVGADR